MHKSEQVNTAAWTPLDEGPITAPQPNRYNEVRNLVLADRRGELTDTERGVLSSALTSAGVMLAVENETRKILAQSENNLNLEREFTALTLAVLLLARLIVSLCKGLSFATHRLRYGISNRIRRLSTPNDDCYLDERLRYTLVGVLYRILRVSFSSPYSAFWARVPPTHSSPC
jgi:hypothetical protein